MNRPKKWISSQRQNQIIIILIFLFLQLTPMQTWSLRTTFRLEFLIFPNIGTFWDINLTNGRVWFPDALMAFIFAISLIIIFTALTKNYSLWIIGFHGLVLTMLYPFVEVLDYIILVNLGGVVIGSIVFTFYFYIVWLLTGLLVLNILFNLGDNPKKFGLFALNLKELMEYDQFRVWYQNRLYIAAGILLGSFSIDQLLYRLFPNTYRFQVLLKIAFHILILIGVSKHYFRENREITWRNYGLSLYLFTSSSYFLLAQGHLTDSYIVFFTVVNLAVLSITSIVFRFRLINQEI